MIIYSLDILLSQFFNQSVIPCPVLTVLFLTCIKFLRRQVKWPGIPISLRIFQFVVIHRVKAFSIVDEEEVDVFLESPCFFYDPADVGNLISGSSVFSIHLEHLEVVGSCTVKA